MATATDTLTTITLPLATVTRLLAVLDDAEQVYGTLDEAGLADSNDRTDADTLSAMLCEISHLHAAAVNA